MDNKANAMTVLYWARTGEISPVPVCTIGNMYMMNLDPWLFDLTDLVCTNYDWVTGLKQGKFPLFSFVTLLIYCES